MNIKDDTIQYFLKIITLVFGILLLFNIVNAIGYFVNEHRNAHPGEMKVKVDRPQNSFIKSFYLSINLHK